MKISERIFFRKMYFSIPLRDYSAPRVTYATLLVGNKITLIDSGVSYHYPDLQELAAEAGVKLSDIDLVINTHCHQDHAGGNYRLKQENPLITFWTHAKSKPMIEDIDSQFKVRPVPGFYTLMGGSVPVDRVLSDGEEIDLGFPVRVLSTPGHSADSISLYLPEDDLLICGDSIPYDHDVPIYDDLDALETSLRKMASLRPKYILSALGGYWDRDTEGDVFNRAFRYLENIQAVVNQFAKEHPDGTPEELARFVLKQIKVDSPIIPFILRSLKEHVQRIPLFN